MLQTSSENVPGWFNFQRLYSDVVEKTGNDPALFVELGFLFGKSSLFMANKIKESGKPIKFFTVDVFSIKNTKQAFSDLNDKQKASPDDLASHLKQIAENEGHLGLAREIISLSGNKDHIQIIPGKGQEIVQFFEDNSIDFLFVDTLHTYEDTVTMLKCFVPKIKSGGILAGHDYLEDRYPGLVQAVNETLKGTIVTRETCFVWTKP